MGRNTWHITREEGALTLTRRLPARFDLAVTQAIACGQRGDMPVGQTGLSKTRLAHQIRQDIWRALQHQRGFSPVVHVHDTQAGVEITAGGAFAGAFAKQLCTARIGQILSCPVHQARWLRHAARRRMAS